MTELIGVRHKAATLRGVRANAGVESRYQRYLRNIVAELHKDVMLLFKANYQPIEVAQDSAEDIIRRFTDLQHRWADRIHAVAKWLPDLIVGETTAASDWALKSALRKAGFGIKFQWTPAMLAMRDVSLAENVSLIKSIPENYLQSVEAIVYEGIKNGGDRKHIAEQLRHQHGVTDRRARLIARDQVRKTTSDLTRVRQQEAGITQGIWRHSGGGNKPRPSHVNADGKIFDLDKGMFLDGEWVSPGKLINCGCYWLPVIPMKVGRLNNETE